MPDPVQKVMRLVSIAILSVLFATTTVLAQDEENPPTLKLDRIMSSPAFVGQTRAAAGDRSRFRVETVVGGLSTPWALAFLPDGSGIVSEYATGNMRLIRRDGSLSRPITGLPEISHDGWAGLFDLVLAPDFAESREIYFSYTAPTGNPDSPNLPQVARAIIDVEALHLSEVQVILSGIAWQEMRFAPDGNLLVSGTGPGDAQDLSASSGKLLRVDRTGNAAIGNPFTDKPGAIAEIFSYGHRDISGIDIHPQTGDIWISEHGARGGDELNVIKAGANYGWPVISYGTEYDGTPVGSGETVSGGMQQPQYFWRPSIAPSGLVFYDGDMFPEWRGNLFVTSLSGQHIARLKLDGDRVVAEERLLVDRKQRIRELRQGPDGALYALTNEESDAPKGTAELLRIYR